MRYTIFQIRDIDNCDYLFRSYDDSKFNFNDYYKVYSGIIDDCSLNEPTVVLEDLFRYFNRVTDKDVERLEKIGFTGHSLSCSDVVKLDDTLYYCDSFGWKKI